jgi:hypothetical protein
MKIRQLVSYLMMWLDKRKQKEEISVYGHNKTIHGTTHLDIELDKEGNVVAVWFRCMPLPFRQHSTNDERAEQMRLMYREPVPLLVAVELIKMNTNVKEF